MNLTPPNRAKQRIDPEKMAYWYFRLNGFFQIESFVVHPRNRGAQRTDADLLAVRFPYRAERLLDDPNDVMRDDVNRLSLSNHLIDVVIAEVKTNQPCTLNGPWTREDRQNVHRVLAAIGCLPSSQIETAAADIYRSGCHYGVASIRTRLIAIGRDRNETLADEYPEVSQLLWADMLEFIWDRLHRYKRQKTQVDQWDLTGRRIKRLADQSGDAEEFIQLTLSYMGVRHTP